jgi:hypothetical protein
MQLLDSLDVARKRQALSVKACAGNGRSTDHWQDGRGAFRDATATSPATQPTFPGMRRFCAADPATSP